MVKANPQNNRPKPKVANGKKLFGFKLIYFERIRIIPFDKAFPTLKNFQNQFFSAFPLITQEMRSVIYFVWVLDDEEIIIRREIEFQFALQHFYERNKLPSFKIWFEDGDDEENTEALIQVSGETRYCLRSDTVIPKIDY